MKKLFILTSIVILSLIGIVGMQSVDARECLSPCPPHQSLKVMDIDENIIDEAKIDQQYSLSWRAENYLSKFDSLPVVVMLYVTDEQGTPQYLAWIEAVLPPNGVKTFDFSWTPTNTGQHTLSVFTWKSLDNPTALAPPVSTTISVTETYTEKSETIVLNVSSDVDYVDDERVYDIVGQRRPAPMPMYDKIIDYEINPNNIEPLGIVTMASIPHEKYSLNHGVGLYIEDWMPTYIPDGYKLLYADTGYANYDWVVNPHERHYVTFQFVPTDFVFYANVTNYELSHKSQGYTVNVKFDTQKFDEIEDVIERFRESRESQSGNYGGHIEMTRDGKTVSAYAGGNDLNPYSAGVAFNPVDEYSVLNVNTQYLTLDELIPIFESIME